MLALGFTEATAQDFFITGSYRGAFDQIDWTQGWTNWNPRNTSYPTGAVTVQGNITTNTTWTASNTYLLKGYVYVKNGATLTIEPGTIIRCDGLSSSTLIVTRGSKIIAAGTPGKPIVFTSSEAAGSRNYGDWGGLVVLGRGLVNASGGVADVGAGINNAGGDGLYGGSDNTDSSGVLRYVRLEFCGIQYSPDKEINGLTLGGVGSKTFIENVQISFSGADAFRFLGGAAQARNLAAHRTLDADFSMELGYTGKLQYAVVLRDSTKAGSQGCSSIEIQNDGLGSAALPFTDPTISNFTLIGPLTQLNTPYSSGYRNGLHIRRNGRVGFFNSVIAGYPRGMMFDGATTGAQLASGNIIIRNCLIAGSKLKQADTTGKISISLPGFDAISWLKEPARSNNTLVTPKEIQLANPYIYNNPQFLPKSGSVLLTGADFNHARLSGQLSVRDHAYLPHGLRAHMGVDGLHVWATSEIAGAATLEICDPLGRVVSSLKVSRVTDHLLPLPGAQGVCLLRIRWDDGRTAACLIAP